MRTLTLAEFLQGYELGYIWDVVVVGGYIYGKDPRGMMGRYEVVRAQVG